MKHGEKGICLLHSLIRNKAPKFQINSDARHPTVLVHTVFTPAAAIQKAALSDKHQLR